MIAPDVNVLVYAARDDAPRHAEFRAWLEAALAAPEPLGIAELVLSGVIRALANRRVFDPPMPLADAYLAALDCSLNRVQFTSVTHCTDSKSRSARSPHA